MYFGSVRFFKNLILLCVITLILIPTVLAVRKHIKLTEAETQIAQLHAELEEVQEPGPVPSQKEQKEQKEEPSAQTVFSAEAPAYQSLYPDFYAPQPLNTQTRDKGVIYLTFDDGPTENTEQVLKILEEEDIKATFFVNGHTDEVSRQRMRDIVAQGHTLGMHSFTHEFDIIYDSVEAFLEDMYQLFTLIREATGEAPTVFRFPGGSINSHNYGIYQELMAEMLRRGFVPFDWNLSAEDATASRPSKEKIISNVLSGASKKVRGFVLMHDGGHQDNTVQALPTIIARFREMGFQFDRIHPDTIPVLFDYPE